MIIYDEHTNRWHSQILSKISISVTSLCWQKILVSSAYSYVWLVDRAFGIPFIHNKNNKGPNIDPSGTRQIMVPASEKTLSNERKKDLFFRLEWNHFLFEKPKYFLLSNKTLWSKIKLLKINLGKHVSVVVYIQSFVVFFIDPFMILVVFIQRRILRPDENHVFKITTSVKTGRRVK